MKRKRLVSLLVLTLMLFTNTLNVFADNVDHSEILDFEMLVKVLEYQQSNFKTKDEVWSFWNVYLKDIYPKYSNKIFPKDYPDSNLAGQPMMLNPDSALKFNIFYYGWATAIKENKQHRSGQWLYLGATADGGLVTNIAHPELKMNKPSLILKEKYINNNQIPYYGLVRPYNTKYSDPKLVGKCI